MHRLVLMRHAKAARGLPDHARPLATRGRRQAALQAGAIARPAGAIDLAIVSDATRALQTLKGLRSGGLTVGQVREEPELYVTDWRGVLRLLQHVDEDVETVLVVGHEPTVSLAAFMLASDDSPAKNELRAGFSTAMAVVASLASWRELAPRCATIDAVLRAAC
ncbi:MAG: histidine phosphatase family protein [Actinomycetaceae bacterium]|nr:histidine phosphatase family protein [Actinomycetaceae bacterium]